MPVIKFDYIYMNEFDSYKNDFGFEIGSGFSGNSDYMKDLDEKEILAQQEYREEQRKESNLEKWLLIVNTFIAIAALLVSIFK